MSWDKNITVIGENHHVCFKCVRCSSVDQELGFQDKYLFYRFLDDEEEDTPLPSEEEKRESEEELPETILFLAQIGPDALLRMILRKSSVTTNNIAWIYFTLAYFTHSWHGYWTKCNPKPTFLIYNTIMWNKPPVVTTFKTATLF